MRETFDASGVTDPGLAARMDALRAVRARTLADLLTAPLRTLRRVARYAGGAHKIVARPPGAASA